MNLAARMKRKAERAIKLACAITEKRNEVAELETKERAACVELDRLIEPKKVGMMRLLIETRTIRGIWLTAGEAPNDYVAQGFVKRLRHAYPLLGPGDVRIMAVPEVVV